MPSNTVSIHPYFEVKEGKLDAFLELGQKLVDKCLPEPKCQYYAFSVNGNTVYCREAYDGAAGVLEHLANAGDMIGAAFEIAELTRIEIHGPAAELDQLKEALTDLNPTYFTLEVGD